MHCASLYHRCLYVYTTFQYFWLCTVPLYIIALCMYTQLSNTFGCALCLSIIAICMYTQLSNTFGSALLVVCPCCICKHLTLQFACIRKGRTFHTLHITKINCTELVQGSWYICGDHTICYNGLRMNGRWHEVGCGGEGWVT